ncbi:hypothetical protein Btru_059455 [Bulinus truncatus]|nr:hypothetical protein Btru_059455 [Bulinus truncatus]
MGIGHQENGDLQNGDQENGDRGSREWGSGIKRMRIKRMGIGHQENGDLQNGDQEDGDRASREGESTEWGSREWGPGIKRMGNLQNGDQENGDRGSRDWGIYRMGIKRMGTGDQETRESTEWGSREWGPGIKRLGNLQNGDQENGDQENGIVMTPTIFRPIRKRVFALTTFAAIIGMVFISYNMYSPSFEVVIFSQLAEDIISSPVSIGKGLDDANSTTCIFPRLNPFEPSVIKLAKLDQKTLTCDTGLPDLTYVQGNQLVLNKTKVKENYSAYNNVTCKYKDILRTNDKDSSFKFSEFKQPFTDTMQLPPETEFILVVCEGIISDSTNGTSTVNVSSTPTVNVTGTPNADVTGMPTVNVTGAPKSSTKVIGPGAASNVSILSRSYLALIPRLDSLNDAESMRLQKRAAESSPKETMNVIVIGFDAVSRYHFMRAMNRTYDLLVNELHSYDMVMYNQVGKNTFPNFLPLFTGSSDNEIYQWWDGKKPLDEFDYIWRDFERAGYRTMFTEDWPQIGAFNYLAAGFRRIPTTYYSKALSYAVENDKEIRKSGGYCVGNQPEVLFHFDYLKRYFDTLGTKKPLFALVYLTRHSHDDVTQIRTIDEHVHRFYAQMNESGLLNNTMLVTFSDHGMRFGALRHSSLGDVEHRNPYAIFTLPPWFAKKYPDVAKNLETNTNRLTTHFDTHATFQDLMYFLGNGVTPLRQPKHGLSLFREIPKNRTCADAAIPPYFCLCDQQYRFSVDANYALSQFLAETVVKSINEKIDQELCHNLTVRKILDVTRVQTAEKNSQQEMTMFKVKVETGPGESVFESVVYAVDTSGGKAWDQLTIAHLQNVTAGDIVDRLNMYRGQSDCVDDVKMKLFCYCNNLLKS